MTQVTATVQAVPTSNQSAAFTFMEAAIKTKTRDQAHKLHAQWSASFQGQPWWGVKTVQSVEHMLDEVQTIMHARDVLSDWYLREVKARAAKPRSKTTSSDKPRTIPAGGKLSDCPIPGWARRPWSKAEQTMVRFSRG